MRTKWTCINAFFTVLPDSVSIEKRTARHGSDASRYCSSFVYPEIMK